MFYLWIGNMGLVEEIKTVFDLTNTDKGYYHGYQYMYANLFHNFKPKSLLEIGVKNGNSISAWQMLFPQASIAGLDIKKRDLVVPESSFKYVIGDSTDPNMSTDLGMFDIIIEDGSHFFLDQINTFLNFKDMFRYYYVIEDINFIANNDSDPSYSLRAIKHVLEREGFRGVAVYDSLNSRKQTKSLVIQSLNF